MRRKQHRKRTRSRCEYCGKTFVHRADKAGRFCGRRCSGLAHRQAKHPCCWCGNPVKHNRQTHCCAACRFADQRAATMRRVGCNTCGAIFLRHRSHVATVNFCSRACHGMWSSMHRTGANSPRWIAVGSTVIRKYKSGDNRAWIKVDEETFIPRARMVLCAAGEDIPDGFVVHHKNGNTLDDRLVNVIAMPRSEHAKIHTKARWRLARQKNKNRI